MSGVDLGALDAALRPIADWLATFAVHSTLALAAALSLSALLSRRGRGAQEAMLRGAMWVPFVSATLQATVFGSPWPGPFAASATAPMAFAAADSPASSIAPALFEVAPALPAPAAAATAEPTAWPWAVVAVGAAGLCALLGTVWLVLLSRRLGRILAARSPETGPRVLATAATMASALGLRHSPHVSRSARLATPIAFGWLRPEICLPARADSLDDAALAALLGHELAHLRRGDPAWMWFAVTVQALFPWQPLLAPVRRRWSRLVELRCDAVAAARTSPTSVARCLVEVAGWLLPCDEPVAALGMAARPSALRERVQAVLQSGAMPRPGRLTASAIAALSLSALTFAAPGAAGREVASPIVLALDAGEDPGRESVDSTDPIAASPAVDRGALAESIRLVQREHDLVAAEAARLFAALAADPAPSSERLAEALRQRLLDLARLRARLEARWSALATRSR